MKKRLRILVMFLTVLMLPACGKETEKPGEDTAAEEEKEPPAPERRTGGRHRTIPCL